MKSKHFLIEDEKTEYEYEYDVIDEEGTKNFGGSRLVGAREGSTRKDVPFVVSINPEGWVG